MSIIRIKFNTNGGEVTNLRIIEHNYGETYNLPNDPKRPGYDFLGWFTDPSNGDRIDENTVVPSRYSQMLYAHWRVKQIKVSFDANGGSVPDDKVVTYQSIYGHLPTSVRYGYEFLGWFDKDKVEPTDIVTVTTDQLLVARWEPKKVNVILDGNTGKPIVRYTKVFDFGERLKLEPTTKDGNTFIGWFTEPVGGIKIEPSHTITSTDDLVLYAQWEVNSYLVSFDKNTGEDLAYDVKTVFFGDKYGTLPYVYKEGHRFVGWVDRHDKVIDALTIMNTPRNHTLTAKWESARSPFTSFDFEIIEEEE